MSRVQRFEDLIAWQKARLLTKAIYQVSQHDAFGRDLGLSGQIQRAAVSVMSNIAEGFERESLKEYHRFLFTAKASCAEVHSQLYVAFDVGYLNEEDFRQLQLQAEEVNRIIGGLRVAVKKMMDDQP